MKYIYFLKAGDNHYKVGIASNVNSRVSGIQTSNPVHIDIVATKLINDAEQVESNIHKALKEMRVDGGGTEWFQLTPAQAIEVAILINKNPEIDISDRITMDAIVRQQKWSQKIINKKLDQVINVYQKHPLVKTVKKIEKQQILTEPSTAKESMNDDDVMTKAIEVFQAEGKASTSLLQRKLSIGYAKAARVMDKLEEAGFITAQDGARPRELINGGFSLTKDEE